MLVLRDHFPFKYAVPFSLALAIGGPIALITTVSQVALLHFLALAGLAFLLVFILFRHPIYRFDRTRNTLTIERRVFGIPQKEVYPLSAIRSVALEIDDSSPGSGSDDQDSGYSNIVKIIIYLNTDKRQRLVSSWYVNINERTMEQKAQVVRTLKTFLGLGSP
ncbi:MAG: hypothetical protein HC840_31675 [Leptolyngbyaceae cyanobacterium RM2_2_4]|nr:hypothetical protein [Leptolyngbyaceae cyanobacterium RM2_2_4]